MVSPRRGWLGGALGLALVLAGATCKVPNDDHCANQAVPGNTFCVELNRATPYCSPCRREFHGCVDYEPFACPGYYEEQADRGESSASDESTTDDPSGSSG